ncbi:MAG TPA: serine hydrolase, partial [Polyangia bacterium]
HGDQTVFDFGEWKSPVASRKNDDGTFSFFTIEPGLGGVELVVGEKDGKRTLTTRDAQHEYVFVEQ